MAAPARPDPIEILPLVGAMTVGLGVAAVVSIVMPLEVAIGAGVLVAVLVGVVCRRLVGAGGGEGALVVRRADAHSDAPPRRPLSLADLGGIALPSDLDTPLSAIDPDAIPSVPREPVRPVAPLASGERMQIFALAVPAAPATDGDATIDALMRRLNGVPRT